MLYVVEGIRAKLKKLILPFLFVATVFAIVQKLALFNLAMNFVATAEELGKCKNSFDAELGWISGRRDEIGARPRSKVHGNPLLAVFGDNMVYGREVEDAQTWQSRLAELAGRDVYNFGQRGFGADQAYISYLKLGREIKTPYVAMGFSLRGINRLVNVYRKFYVPESGMPFTKPRFELERGRLKRIPNPLADAGQMEKLRSAEFVASLGKLDPWFIGRQESWWKNFAPHFRGRKSSPAEMDLKLWSNPEVRGLMAKILARFSADVREQGAQPVIMILPALDDATEIASGNRQGLAQMLEICLTENLVCFNGSTSLIKASKDLREGESLWLKTRSLSPQGHQVVAEALAAFLQVSN